MTETPTPPSALESLEEISARLRGRRTAIFFDYDGTLTPIVPRPEMALLSDDMRARLRDLAQRATVAIISGRDLEDVRRLVALDELYYAGSHGFDIAGPGGFRAQQGREFTAALDAAEGELRPHVEAVKGAILERKQFAIAVHYRLVSDGVPTLLAAVEEVLRGHPELTQTGGKKIVELRPAIEWDKGKAVLFLLRELRLEGAVPLYLGDDLTDEDAFRELRQRGIGIVVQEEPRPTLAHYRLHDVGEVARFLSALAAQLN